MTETQEQKNTDVKVNVVMSAFPMSKWGQWDEDCKANFGDCRWMKAIHDHEFVKQVSKMDKLEVALSILQQEIADLKSQPIKKEKKTVKTLGGEQECE